MTKTIWLRAQIANGVTDFGILNTAQLIDNPTPRGTVSAPFDIAAISNVIPPSERFAIQETETYKMLLDAIESKNLAWVSDQIENLVAAGKISSATLALLTPLLSATIPDPDYSPKVSRSSSQQAGFDEISYQDWELAIALNANGLA